jgi:hypothetical protein
VEKHTLPPDPERMIEGLRDTGYTFNTAVADIIDNSIAAKAENINLIFSMDYHGNIIIRFIDDGDGMDNAGLLNAMKYGSNERLDPMSLGKFGLGLKTASTAYCRKLSVVSRTAEDAVILKATWDLDHVADVDEWELLLPEPTEEDLEYFQRQIGINSGTMVIWEKVDRLLKDYVEPGGRPARKGLQKAIDNLIEHISMTYQRFLDEKNEREKHKVKIKVTFDENVHAVEPWDPFQVEVSELVAEKTLPVMRGDGEAPMGEFTVKAYILPRKNEYASDEDYRKAKLSNDLQGFYIYRQNRLIHYADWLNMFSKEPHGTLLRVDFSFDYQLDDAFQVDIKKSKISLNEDIYNWLKNDFVALPRNAADLRYRKGQQVLVDDIAKGGAHVPSNKNIQGKESFIKKAEITNVDKENQTAEISNDKGKTKLRINISAARTKDEIFVQPKDGLDEGLLWEPALIYDEETGANYQGVQINTKHDFYTKVYVPNIQSEKSSSINIQGLDALLWALAKAEWNTTHTGITRLFKDIKYEISRILRLLVEDLPDPKIEE